MARVHGKKGSVSFATGYDELVQGFTVDRGVELADGTVLGSENRTKSAGLGTASGTYTCFVDDTVPLHDAGEVGAATFVFTSGRQVTATIIIGGFSVNVGLDGLETVTYRWELGGDGSSADFGVA